MVGARLRGRQSSELVCDGYRAPAGDGKSVPELVQSHAIDLSLGYQLK